MGGTGLMKVDPRAGTLAVPTMLVNIPRLMTAYYTRRPDPKRREQRVAFGTSGHRGSALVGSFNETHILAITEAICAYRRAQGIDGPLFLGIDTHALSESALASALEVLAAHGVDVTEDGGFKYNPPHGGPADTHVTGWIQDRANALLADGLAGVERIPFERARRASTTHGFDYMGAYIADLGSVIDMEVVRGARVALAVDPLGGAGVDYWSVICDRYRLPMTVVSDTVDPTFAFMTVDWDGKIRMDCSSPYAMRRLVGLKDRFDVAWACDTDHDRHGIAARSAGLMNPNHYLAVAISYLFRHRPAWPRVAGIGKTLVSSSMIDRVAAGLGRSLLEVPVGFKWFVDGLIAGSLGFGGEESAGASFLRRDGTVWTTDKDGIILGLLSAEMTAVTGRDPGELYRELTADYGECAYERIDAPAAPEEKARLARLSPEQITTSELAGERITALLTTAPGNNAPIGGLKVVAPSGWFAARPSGTEDVYKLYAESFKGSDHLRRIQEEALAIIQHALRSGP